MITLPRAESHWTRGCETEAGGEGGTTPPPLLLHNAGKKSPLCRGDLNPYTVGCLCRNGAYVHWVWVEQYNGEIATVQK